MQRDRIAASVVFAAVFLAALRHLHPAFRLDDSPETIAAAAALGVQHMPGYPLITLIGRLAVALPVGGVALRVNLVAALLVALCAAGIGFAVTAFFPTPAGTAAGAAAGLLFASCGPVQETALSAKGAIYALNLLVTLALIRGTVRRAPSHRLAWLAGLGLANHWMSVVCWFPLGLASRAAWTARRAATGAVFLLLGLSLYLQLPLSAMRQPVWGDPATARGLVAILLRTDVAGQAAARPAGTVALQLGWNALEPVRASGIPFMLLGLAGAVALARHRPQTAGLAGLGCLVTLIAVAAGANPIHHRTGERVLWFTEPFLLPWLGVFSIAAGAGLLLARTPLRPGARRWFWAGALACPLLTLGLTRAVHDHSADYLGWDFGHNALDGLPRPGVMLAEADFSAWPALALCTAGDPGPKHALVLTRPFLERDWGWRRAARQCPALQAVGITGLDPDARAAALSTVLVRTVPVWHLGDSGYPSVALRQRLVGLSGPVLPPGAPRLAVREGETARWFARARLRGLYGTTPPKDPLTLVTLDQYVLARSRPAEAARTGGRIAEAVAGFRLATTLPGLFVRAQTLRNLGLGCALLGDDAGAERAFAAAARLRPADANLWANAGIACQRQGKSAEARVWLTAALRIDPAHAGARAALAALP